jgi:two-component system sensor histidine kinase UhpB
LRESEERHRSIITAALDAVITIDSAGLITRWNRQAETIFGWSQQEAVGRPLVTTIIPFRYYTAHERGLKRFLATGTGVMVNRRIEITALHRDGHEFPVELTVSPIPSGGTWTFSAFIRDITTRKGMKEALRDSEQRYRIISELISDYAYATRLEADGTYTIEWATQTFTRLTGFTVEQGPHPPGTWTLLLHPEDIPIACRRVHKLLSGHADVSEFRILTKSGEIRWVQEYGRPV